MSMRPTAAMMSARPAGGNSLLAALAYPGGMGMGDVKLAAVMGLYLGRAVAPAMLIAMVAGVLVGAFVIARQGARAGRKTAVPFGPFLALGALVAIFAGEDLVRLYTDHFLHERGAAHALAGAGRMRLSSPAQEAQASSARRR